MEIQNETGEVAEKRKYYPKVYKRLFLQDRDVEMMNYCLEQKFLTLEQVAKRFFKSKEGIKYPLHTAYRRVLTLQKFGLVTWFPYEPGGKKGVQTTKLGEEKLKNRGIEPLPVCGINYATAEHDRRLTDVRIVFEELGLLSAWTSDRFLKSRVTSGRVPDAIFRFKKGHSVALEVEIAWKGKERYLKIFDEYTDRKFGEVKFLFYICNTVEQIKKLAALTESQPWVYFGLYEQLMRKKGDTAFANKKSQFRLRDLA